MIINNSVYIIVDEEFLYDQTQHYFRNEFNYYNSKLTTFPGMFIITTIVWKIMSFFSLPLIHFRFIPLVASLITFYFINKFSDKMFLNSNQKFYFSMLAYFLPINYFFYFVYYTESLSNLSVVLYFYYMIINKDLDNSDRINAVSAYRNNGINNNIDNISNNTSNNEINKFDIKLFFLQIFSVSIRQNNIIWLNYFNLKYVLEYFIFSSNNNSNNKQSLATKLATLVITFKEIIITDILFIIFFISNNFSIVLGHNEHHKLSFHLAQINHFVFFFYLFFPSINLNLIEVVNFSITKKPYFSLFLKSLLPVSIVVFVFDYFFLEYHEFLLSDNRHYSYYYFSKILSNNILKFLRVVYISVLSSVLLAKYLVSDAHIKDRNINNDSSNTSDSSISNINGNKTDKSNISASTKSVLLSFAICLSLNLVPTRLFDFRYLGLGYIIVLILIFNYNSKLQKEIMFSENIFYSIVINLVVLYVFIFKPFVNEYFNSEVSRFMW